MIDRQDGHSMAFRGQSLPTRMAIIGAFFVLAVGFLVGTCISLGRRRRMQAVYRFCLAMLFAGLVIYLVTSWQNVLTEAQHNAATQSAR